jgi:hypothetical protein
LEPPFWTKDYSHDELMHVLESAYAQFYIRPRYILKRMLKIRTPEELIRHIRMGSKVVFGGFAAGNKK